MSGLKKKKLNDVDLALGKHSISVNIPVEFYCSRNCLSLEEVELKISLGTIQSASKNGKRFIVVEPSEKF